MSSVSRLNVWGGVGAGRRERGGGGAVECGTDTRVAEWNSSDN